MLGFPYKFAPCSLNRLVQLGLSAHLMLDLSLPLLVKLALVLLQALCSHSKKCVLYPPPLLFNFSADRPIMLIKCTMRLVETILEVSADC
jgi:hypothetical protein